MNDLDSVIGSILSKIVQDGQIWAETVQVGDWVDSSMEGYYTFSNHKYKTQGKLYQVREVDLRPQSKTVIVDGDYQDPENPKPERVWLGPSRVIIRDRKIIWESSLQKAINLYFLSDEKHTLSGEELLKLEEMRYVPDLSNLQ